MIMPRPLYARILAAEFLGTMFLLATVIGSGIMAERLADGDSGCLDAGAFMARVAPADGRPLDAQSFASLTDNQAPANSPPAVTAPAPSNE